MAFKSWGWLPKRHKNPTTAFKYNGKTIFLRVADPELISVHFKCGSMLSKKTHSLNKESKGVYIYIKKQKNKQKNTKQKGRAKNDIQLLYYEGNPEKSHVM